MSHENFLGSLEELKQRRSLNDSQVAKLLGITRQFLFDVKSGKAKPSAKLLFRLYDALGYAWTRDAILELLLPDEIAESIRQKDNARSKPDDPKAP